MGGAAFQGRREVEIVPVFGGLFVFTLHYFSADDSLMGKEIAHCITGTFVFAHLLGDNVAGTFQSILCVFDIAFDERRNTGAGLFSRCIISSRASGSSPFWRAASARVLRLGL